MYIGVSVAEAFGTNKFTELQNQLTCQPEACINTHLDTVKSAIMLATKRCMGMSQARMRHTAKETNKTLMEQDQLRVA